MGRSWRNSTGNRRGFARRMPAITSNLLFIRSRILTQLAAILLLRVNLTVAGWMGAFLTRRWHDFSFFLVLY